MTTFSGVLNAATRNAGASTDIAIAAGQIIARRVVLGMAAAFDPMGANHAEFGRMMPEKFEAFSAAGMIMLEQSNQAGWEFSRLASDEVMTTARATLAMAVCDSPVAMADAQGAFALAWFVGRRRTSSPWVCWPSVRSGQRWYPSNRRSLPTRSGWAGKPGVRACGFVVLSSKRNEWCR